MLVLENILLALNGLRSNLMRTLLTMLGIIIGIGSVIAIMTVGNSITTMVNTTWDEVGAKDITISVVQKAQSEETDDTGMRFGMGGVRRMTSDDYITDEMIDGFLEEYGDQITRVVFQEGVGSGRAVDTTDSDKYANVSISGVNNDALTSQRLEMTGGREFTQRDQDEARKVCIVSDYFVNNMFNGDMNAALGSEVTLSIFDNYYTYHVIGVYKFDDQYLSMFSSVSAKDMETAMYIPYQTARNQLHSSDGYTSFTVALDAETDSQKFMDSAEYYFNVYYVKNQFYQVSASSLGNLLDSMNDMMSAVSKALSIIAGISLLVGGIGVMNIMLVSITERTKEIGTRKALGATNASIRLQFITESIVICIIGGIIGIILGITAGTLLVKAMNYEAAPSLSSILLAVGFSMAIGLFFGYYPANKAAKLNPIDALRYE